MRQLDSLKFENAQILFRNFSGEKSQFNQEGNITFSILIDDHEFAKKLTKLGWNIKPLRNENEEIENYHLPVRINYDSNRPPEIYRVTPSVKKAVLLNKNSIEALQHGTIDYVDALIDPYIWQNPTGSGVKAYCNQMWAIIKESELDLKWASYMNPADDVSLPF